MLREGSRTPWGKAQVVTDIAEGIHSVSTAGHGGIKLDRKRQLEMPKLLRRPGGWYEEDCDWALVATAFPQYFKENVDSAHKTLRNWFPDTFEAFFQCVILPGHSTVKDEKAFKETHKNDWIVTSAFGDWHPGVPKGMVGVIATQGGLQTGPKRQFLLSDAEYDNRSFFGFVIDPNKHKEFNFLARKAV